MPIYAYKCDACGFAKDVLQKISDDSLTDCPKCGKADFKKQVTAAGFQLKGSGWYVTDFRGDSSAGAAKPDTQGAPAVAGEPATPPGADASAPAAASAPPVTGAVKPVAAASAAPSASGPPPAAST